MTAPLPDQRRRRRLSREARAVFLVALAAGWSVTHAAGRTGFHRRRFYEVRDADEAFAEQWAQAWQAGLEALVDEARRRAVDGVEEPVFQKGELVGTVRRYSDNLLMFLIKQRDPAFRDKHRVELTGAEGAPIQLEGRAVVGIADVVQLAIETGQAHLLGIPGLDADAARRALSASADVLPDPADGEPPAGSVPAA